MRLVWDEPKRLANLDKHGWDFAQLEVEFFLGALVVPGREGRFRAIGTVGDRPVTVVFTRLGLEALSIISMRPASRRERSLLP